MQLALAKLSLSSNLPLLQRGDTPSFLEIDDEQQLFDIDSRFNQHVDIDNGNNTLHEKRKNREFFFCSVFIDQTSFVNNSAFGQGIATGSGGALFFSGCSVNVIAGAQNNEMFKGNVASIGGAIASLYSSIFIQNVGFADNIAYRYGGAIAFQGHEVDGKVLQFTLQVRSSTFKNNAGFCIGGSFLLTAGYDAYFEGTSFQLNKAGISGGAFYIVNTGCKFFDCDFIGNIAGEYSVRTLKTNSTMDNLNEKISFGLSGRGGGAIMFVSDDSKQRKLYTQVCCFLENRAINGTSFQPEGKGAGHVVFFDGFCIWHSQNDFYKDWQNTAIGNSSRRWQKSLLIMQYEPSESTCTDLTDSYSSNIEEYAYNVSFAPNSNVGSGATSLVPSPTTYSYVATPITQLPYPTTSSLKLYQTTIKFPFMNFTRTIHATPRQTPGCSPITPVLTPMPTTPMETRHRSPIETPQSSPDPTPLPRSPLTTPETTQTTPDTTLLQTLEKTLVPSHEKTLIPTLDQTLQLTPAYSTPVASTPPLTRTRVPHGYNSELIVISTSYIYTQTYISTKTLTQTTSTTNNDQGFTITDIETDTFSVSYMYTYGATKTEIGLQNEQNPTIKDNSLIIIIAAAISGVILIIIIVLLVWFFLGYSKSSSSSNSIVEMDEETVIRLPDSTSAPITNDNPLWTTSVMGDTDDPFRNDFEEVAAEGFFNDRFNTVDSDP